MDNNLGINSEIPEQELEADDCRTRFLSDTYADFIVELSGYPGLQLEEFQEPCSQNITGRFGIVHINREQLELIDLMEFKYYSIPNLYGLMQENAAVAVNAVRMQNQPSLQLKGQGVIIGFVDTGIDYTHKAFRLTSGQTRIISIWDQTIQEGEPPKGYYYGTEYSEAQINEALESDTPYEFVPSRDEDGHGTFLAGVAAGSQDIQSSFVGVAPESTLAIVKLKTAKPYLLDYYTIKEGAAAYQETDIMLGIRYLTELGLTLQKPIVILVGLGTNQGNHAGKSPLGLFLNVTSTVAGVGMVIAGGNEGNKRHHFQGKLENETEYEEVEINVGSGERGFVVELWGTSPEIYSVSIVSPTGEINPRIPAGIDRVEKIEFVFDNTIIYVQYEIVEVRTGDQLISIHFIGPSEGVWRVRVYGNNLVNGIFHMWLPIAQFVGTDTVFLNPTPDVTLTEPSNGFNPITVSGYNSISGSLFPESSRGFTTENYYKPNIAAPAVDVIGPALNGEYTTKSGTSISAAVTAGATAQMFTWDMEENDQITFNTIDIRNYWIRGATRSSGTIYPNKALGYGLLDVYNTFEVLVQR